MEYQTPTADDADGILDQASEREHGVLERVVRGLDNKSIAEEMEIKDQTVKNHIHDLALKAHISTTHDPQIRLAVKFCRIGIRKEPEPDIVDSLTSSHFEIIAGLVNDLTTDQIAAKLGLRSSTVQKALHEIHERIPLTSEEREHRATQTRLRIVALYIAYCFPALTRLRVRNIGMAPKYGMAPK